MTQTPPPSIMGPRGELASHSAVPDLPLQHNKVVLVMDLVESVRLMASNEASVVFHWHSFLQHARDEVLPRHGGRLVKSLGDGILVEFDNAAPAAKAALSLHRFFDKANLQHDDDSKLWLRAGLNATHLYLDEGDVFGHGVNLAARVAGLANPGETVITANVYDALVDGVDADMQDMGESYLKHWPEPVRTWTISPPTTSGIVWRQQSTVRNDDFRATIAVLPFASRSTASEHFVIGDLLADGVIVQLSRSQQLRVISRLSTSVLRGRSDANQTANQLFDARFVLSGSYVTHGDKVLVSAELSDTRLNEVVWADRMTGDAMDVLQQDSQLINALASTCTNQLLQSEVQRTLSQALPRLDSSALMLGAINLMHRSTRRDLERSQVLLETLVERHKRSVVPWAWMAKWYVMQVIQGQTDTSANAFQRAIEIADRALDLSPDSSLAMAIKGHAMCHLGKDVDASRRLLQESTQSNPNDPMAWLYSSVWSTMWGDGSQALLEAQTAFALSPLDPLRYTFEMCLGGCYAAIEEWEKSAQTCRSSLRANRFHLPTLRCLLLAEHELGNKEQAHTALKEMLSIDPNFSVRGYLSTGPENALRRRIGLVLVQLGAPG